MTKFLKNTFMAGLLILPLLFLANCQAKTDPATDGPSCSEATLKPGQCFDSLATDDISNLAFKTSCNAFGGLYSTSGCSTATYDIAGHCEYPTSATGNLGFTVSTAVYYKSTLYATSSVAKTACESFGGVWK